MCAPPACTVRSPRLPAHVGLPARPPEPCTLLHASDATCCPSFPTLPAAGNFKMELMNAPAGHEGDDLALCLSSVRFDVYGNCSVAITATAAGGNFVPAMWQPSTADALTYKQYAECPSWREAVTFSKGDNALTGISTAFSNFIYGPDKPVSTVLAVPNAGVVTATVSGTTFTYAITEATTFAAADFATGVAAKIAKIAATTNLPAGTFVADTIVDPCAAGRYALILTDALKNTIKFW